MIPTPVGRCFSVKSDRSSDRIRDALREGGSGYPCLCICDKYEVRNGLMLRHLINLQRIFVIFLFSVNSRGAGGCRSAALAGTVIYTYNEQFGALCGNVSAYANITEVMEELIEENDATRWEKPWYIRASYYVLWSV